MPRHDPARQRRRVIRLSILAGVLLLLGGGLYGLYVYQSGRQQVQADQAIREAREAFAEDDYARVIELLENPSSVDRTRPEIRDNAELLGMYVKARREVPLPGYEHKYRLAEPLKQIVRLEPENVEAREELLGLLTAMRRNDEALEIASGLSERFPDDAKLARYVGMANLRLGERDKARAAFQRAAEIDPLDVLAQVEVIRLLKELGEDTGPFIATAESLLSDHPEDPRAELIRALAYLAGDNVLQARILLTRAATREPIDDAFAGVLATWLDTVDLYDQSNAYLQRVAGEGIDTPLKRETLFRAYENDDLQSVLSRLEGQDPEQPDAYMTDVLAVWALASARQGDPDQAGRLVNELEARGGDDELAWAKVLKIALAAQSGPGPLIDAITGALPAKAESTPLGVTRQQVYLREMLGEAYLRANELDSARAVLEQVAASRGRWAKPHRLLAETLLELGEPAEAHRYAQQALLRQTTFAAYALRSVTALASTNPADQDAVDRALNLAEKDVLHLVPDDARVLPAAVGLLARAGREAETRRRIEAVLNQDPPASSAALSALAGVSRRYALGLETRIDSTIREHHGVTADIVLAQARDLAASGQPDEGRALIERSMPDPTTLGWRVTLATYLSGTRSPDAPAYWAELADRHPDNLTLQLDALRAPGVRRDHDFARRAIQRLKSLAGEASINWKIEQARLLMEGQPSAIDLDRTLALLREAEQSSPHQLDIQLDLTRCLVLKADLIGAEQAARAAKGLAPNQPSVRLILGQVLHEQRRFNEARIELTAVVSNTDASPGLRVNACELLFLEGEVKAVEDALESIRRAGEADTRSLLLLARVYANQNRYDQADAICEVLVKQPDTDVITFVSAYYEQTGRPEQAQQARELAGTSDISPADRLMLDALGAAERGEQDAAMRFILGAAEQDPSEPRRWRDAAQLALSMSRAGLAQQHAERGLREAGEDAGLRAVIRHRDLIAQVETDPALVPLTVAILQDDALRPVSVEALQVVKEGGEAQRVAGRLADLAATQRGFLALHELAADRLLLAGEDERALELASSTMARFPTSAAAARVTSMAAYRLRDWGKLLNAASQWARRDPTSRALADLMLAAAQSELKRYDLAIQTLTPHLAERAGGPDGNEAYYELYSRALARTGKPGQALSLLEPHLQDSATARAITLRLIRDDLDSADAVNNWLPVLGATLADDRPGRFELSKAAFQAGLRLNNEPLLGVGRDAIDRLIAEPGPHPIEMYFVHAQMNQALGALDAAEQSFRQVLQTAPDNGSVLNNLAMVLAEQGGARLTEAEQLAGRAVAAEPENPNFLDTLAIVRLRRGNLDQALSAIDKAIGLDARTPDWRLTRADILEAQGKTEQAAEIRRRYQP